jgi:molybdate transport system regulatory protein
MESPEASTMTGGAHLTIRIDLRTGARIGPGEIKLLGAIRSTGSISAAARSLGMSRGRAWLLVEEINRVLRKPAVTAAAGGIRGGGAVVTPVGERIVALYQAIELQARTAASVEFGVIRKLIRSE